MSTDNTPGDEEDPRDILELTEREKRMPLEACDSPIEDMFLWDFRKVAHEHVTIQRQLEVQTRVGCFRLDFFLSRAPDGPRVGIECDGRDFHSAERDAKRDAAIVETGVVTKVYRLRGRDICWSIHEVLEMLSHCEPALFSEAGHLNLESLLHQDYVRDDYRGRVTGEFPYGAIRDFELKEPIDDDGYGTRPEDPPPLRPIVIVWTAKQKG